MSYTPPIQHFTIYNINVIDNASTLGSVENVILRTASNNYNQGYDSTIIIDNRPTYGPVEDFSQWGTASNNYNQIYGPIGNIYNRPTFEPVENVSWPTASNNYNQVYEPSIPSLLSIKTTDNRPTVGPVEHTPRRAAPNDNLAYYNPKYDAEVNRLLNEVEEELLSEYSEVPLENYDFPEDTHHIGPIPDWYQEMLQSKIKEANSKLKRLSNIICDASPSTAAHIKRIEEDHSTTFCKMDYPRHPPMNKPWSNVWKLFCIIKCKEIDNDPNHVHTTVCQSLELEYQGMIVSMATSNNHQNDYPPHLIHAVKLFQEFAMELTKEKSFSDSTEDVNTIYDKSMWATIRLVVRSNHLNQFMMVVYGKKISKLIPHLKTYFNSGPGRNSKVSSVVCFDQTWKGKKRRKEGVEIAGIFELKDKIGPISLRYDVDTHRFPLNSVEIMQLGKIIQDYIGLTKETTLLDFAQNIGILSLILALKCEKTIGLSTVHNGKFEICEAERLKKLHKIHNASFIACKPEEVLTICTPLIEQCITVATLNLSSPYGKSRDVMKALRDMPSIWRIIIYGSFDDKFHENIAVLTSEDDTMGERYLPMQGCILDKSTSIVNAFDIVILFERKSLFEPKLELLAPGPTLNVKLDSNTYDYGSLDAQEMKPESPMNRDLELKNSMEKSKEGLPSTCATKKKPQQYTDNQSFLFNPSLSVKEEFQFNYPLPPPLPPFPPPPLERFPSPPPLPPSPLEANCLEKNCPGCSLLTTVKGEPVQLSEDKKDDLLNPKDNGIANVNIKSEPTDPSDCVGFSEINCENIPLHVTVNSSQLLSIKHEPEDMEISPNPPDIESMKTPIHNPRVLSDNTHSVFRDVAVNDSEFSVQANLSFLGKLKRDSEQSKIAINVEREPGEIIDSDEDIEIYVEEKNKKQKESEPRILVKPVNGIIKVESKLEHDLSRKYKRHLLSSPPPYYRNYKRSPSPYYSNRYRRSPNIKRFRRSPSPDETFYRRRSPLSPERSRRQTFSSSSSRRRERFNRSPSPLPSHEPFNKKEIHGRIKPLVMTRHDRRKRRSRSRSPT